MAKLILSDNTEIVDLKLNGNNLVSENKIDESVFNGKLSPLMIENDGGDLAFVYENAVLVQQVHYENMPGLADGWYINFRDMTSDELTQLNNDLAIVELYEMVLGDNE